MSRHNFLPDSYKAPKAQGNYMKLETGDNKIRILSKPIFGWEDWTIETPENPKKPIRYQYHDKPVKPIDPKQPIKHFWSMIVWNYKEERVQVLHITQAGIRDAIENLSRDEDWGAPWGYDLKIVRTGDKKETKYAVTPSSPKAISETIRSAFYQNRVRLEALFVGEDPFAVGDGKYTLPAFEEEKDDFAEEREETALQQLEQELVLDGLPIDGLAEYIKMKAIERKTTEEKYILAALNPASLPVWKSQYTTALMKQRKAS